MEQYPLVSVGVPTYNRPGGLQRALESLTRQTYTNLEIIVSDNCSPDPEVEQVVRHCMAYDSMIRYVRQEKNMGPALNFEFVLRQATGEYFQWLADDDWLDPNYIQECLKVLISSPDYVLACGRANHFNNETSVQQGEVINLHQESGADRVLEYYRTVVYNGAFYGVIRRQQLLQIPLRTIIGADWFYIAALAFMGKICTLETVCIHRTFRDIDPVSFFRQAYADYLPDFCSRHPFITVAVAAFHDIMVASPMYRSLPFLKRLRLAYKSSLIILEKNVLPYHPTITKGIHACSTLKQKGEKYVKAFRNIPAITMLKSFFIKRRRP